MPFLHGIPVASLAQQLAALLNKHNQLANRKNADSILRSGIDYITETHGRLLIGACGLQKQSYSLTEIKHLVVSPQWRGKGVAKFLVRRATDLAKTPLVYATVREDNPSSVNLFKGLGFEASTTYKSDGHQVLLLTRANPGWQKQTQYSFVLSPEISPPEYI